MRIRIRRTRSRATRAGGTTLRGLRGADGVRVWLRDTCDGRVRDRHLAQAVLGAGGQLDERGATRLAFTLVGRLGGLNVPPAEARAFVSRAWDLLVRRGFVQGACPLPAAGDAEGPHGAPVRGASF